MCGIVGILLNNDTNIDLKSSITKMTKSLNHRGPDSNGSWINNERRIALGHTRLSILDLSEKGSQPMINNGNKDVIIYNGEIYNHLYLRKFLSENYSKNINWTSHSDTETLLKCISYMGLDKTLEMVDGMFAFALYDYKKNTLSLVRDRFGQKPLYYGWINNNFIFASELKALKEFPGFDNGINLDSLSLYFKFMYVPSPYTIFKKIYKLRPGHLITLSLDKNYNFVENTKYYISKNFSYRSWWTLENQIKNSRYKNIKNNIDRSSFLSKNLSNTINDQLISDVPIGCFLSGGIDSSLVTSIMSKVSKKKISTFSVGIDNYNYDESKYAKEISNYLQTDHNELIVNEKDLINTIYKIPNIYDEPFADSSQIPTYLISKFARQKIKVVLTGDGGDELFGGYNRYIWANKLWNIIKYFPFPIRKRISFVLLKLPESFAKILINTIIKFTNFNIDKKQSLEKFNKFLIKLENISNLDDLYFSLITEWKEDEEIILEDTKNKPFSEFVDPDINLSYQEKMMYWDSLTYLPDDILCKVDRASMSVGLESRLPFLGNKVVDAAWSIPLIMKINNQDTKLILKKLLANHLPENLFLRPKMGFSVPIGSWFRNKLKDFVFDNLSKENLQKDNILNYNKVESTINNHIYSNHNNQHKIWSLLVFQLWNKNK